jgi:hypothetical protein
MTKKKQSTLSTGSIIAIVVGIIVVVFMLLTFVDSQNNYEEETQDNYQVQFDVPESQSNNPTCNEEEILGAEDMECHPKCGDGYCEDDSVCYKSECYYYPHSAIACFDEIEENHDVFTDSVKEVDRLPGGTYDEALYKFNMVVVAFNKMRDSSEHCLNELDDSSFLLEELGYDIGTYFDWWNEVIASMDTTLDKQREVLENY